MRDERRKHVFFPVCTQQSTKVTRLLWYYWHPAAVISATTLQYVLRGRVLLAEFILFRFRFDESNSVVFRTLQHVGFVEMKSTFSGFAKNRMEKNGIGNRSRLHSRTPLEPNVCTRPTFEMQQRWQSQHVCLNVWRWIGVAGAHTTFSILTLLHLVWLSDAAIRSTNATIWSAGDALFQLLSVSIRYQEQKNSSHPLSVPLVALSLPLSLPNWPNYFLFNLGCDNILDEMNYCSFTLKAISSHAGRDFGFVKKILAKENKNKHRIWLAWMQNNVEQKRRTQTKWHLTEWKKGIVTKPIERTAAATVSWIGSSGCVNRKFICSFVVFSSSLFFISAVLCASYFFHSCTKVIIKCEFCGCIFSSIPILGYQPLKGLNSVFNTQRKKKREKIIMIEAFFGRSSIFIHRNQTMRKRAELPKTLWNGSNVGEFGFVCTAAACAECCVCVWYTNFACVHNVLTTHRPRSSAHSP